MKSFDEKLKDYAALAVEVGVNVQKNQTLILNAPIEAVAFVRLVAQKAYEKGIKDIQYFWNDDKLQRMHFEKAPIEAFEEYPKWKAEGLKSMAKNGACVLTIYATDPELLKGIDPERIRKSQKTSAKALKPYKDLVTGGNNNWSIVSIPTKAWAKKVFAHVSEEEAIKKLWEAIFSATRINEEDPVKAWKDHSKNLKEKVTFLNQKKFKMLHYKGPGTDLKIELPSKHIWEGADEDTHSGITFLANIPTEEVFTLPKRDGVNGVVSSTKPLNYGGNLIDDFSLTFKDGKVIDYEAKVGYDALKNMLSIDEGAKYLGEVALVPYDSPISQANILFYNTLFDENASCHLAIGSAYPSCLEDGVKMSKEELKQNGANDSLTHVDFMIGSSELDIDGIDDDGNCVSIFRKGHWAI